MLAALANSSVAFTLRAFTSEESHVMAAEKHPATAQTLGLASDIVAAYVSNNRITEDALPGLLQTVHDAIRAVAGGSRSLRTGKAPAVPISRSITNDYIVCLEDGKKLKTLKRYLRAHYNLSPEEYRAKWALPSDYPMAAPAYSKRRSQLAKQIGLGRRPNSAGKPAPRSGKKKRGRPRTSG